MAKQLTNWRREKGRTLYRSEIQTVLDGFVEIEKNFVVVKPAADVTLEENQLISRIASTITATSTNTTTVGYL